MSGEGQFDKWAATYRQWASEGAGLMWPSETLVRLFKGTYVPDLDKNYVGKKVIDVGFGNGNNLAFLVTLGIDLYGTEVSAEICDLARAKLAHVGCTADLRVGTNRQLPFGDGQFDFLVSWNVLHYENTSQAIREAIAEYYRVLKTGGRFFVSTTGAKHKILQQSTRLGGHRYLIGRDDDFRKGEVFFYFDTASCVRRYFAEHFADVAVGRTHDHLLTETLDWFIVTGVKE